MSVSMRPTDTAEVVTTTAEGFRPAAKSGLQIVVTFPGTTGRRPVSPRRRRPGPPWRPTPIGLPSSWPTSSSAITFARTTVSVTMADNAGPAPA